MARAIHVPISLIRTAVETVIVDDATLVRRAQADRLAFGPLYERYVPNIYRFCAIRLRTREVAEDATAQVFSKAMLAIGTCDPDRFRSWLFAIATRVVADLHRSHRASEPIDAALDRVDDHPTPDQIAVRNDDEARVLALLSHLTAEQRDIVELRLAGLNGAEIADALDISQGAVRAAQFRAYARLRGLVHDLGFDLGDRP